MSQIIGLSTGGGSNTEFKKCTCTAAEQIGWFVYNSGNNEVRGAIANDTSKSHVVGLIIKKISTTECIIQTRGFTKVLTGLTSKTIGFLSQTTVGGVQFTQPSGAGIILKQVGYAIDAEDFLIDIHASGTVLAS